jgi:Calx-beta domain
VTTITVPITADGASEPSPNPEVFKVKLTTPDVPSDTTTAGHGSICDTVSGFSVNNTDPVEEGTNVVFTVIRSGPTNTAATVNYTTTNGTAVSPSDFTAKTGTLNFGVNDTSKTVTVTTLADADASGPENFTLTLSVPSSGMTLLDPTGEATLIESSNCESNEIAPSQAHKYQGAELYFELFRYLTGGPIHKGRAGDNDFTGPSSSNLDTECYQPGLDGTDENAANLNLDPTSNGVDESLMWDVGGPKLNDAANVAVIQGNNYKSPYVDGMECAKTFAINMLFGVSQQDNDANALINQSRANYGTAILPMIPSRM